MGFIYKITNIISKKCYIGETNKSNPYLRWNEHKRKIEKGIGCPALQDAVKKYGIKNFTFEILIICFDEDRYKFEIEYIKKFNSIAPNGYNLTKGGEGGGFYNKKHKPETIKKIVKTCKQKYIDNPELKIKISEIQNGIKNSEKFKVAKQEKRLGNINNRKHNEETKNKISKSIKNYFTINNINNIEKHRLLMAESKGVKVQQCNKELAVINTFISLSDAERQTGISRTTIQNGIKDSTKLRGGFIWKKI